MKKNTSNTGAVPKQNSADNRVRREALELATYAAGGSRVGQIEKSSDVSMRNLITYNGTSYDSSTPYTNFEVLERRILMNFQQAGLELGTDAWEQLALSAMQDAVPGSQVLNLSTTDVSEYFQVATAIWAVIYSFKAHLQVRIKNTYYDSRYRSYSLATSKEQYTAMLTWALDTLPLPKATHKHLSRIFRASKVNAATSSFILINYLDAANVQIGSSDRVYCGMSNNYTYAHEPDRADIANEWTNQLARNPRLSIVKTTMKAMDSYDIVRRIEAPMWNEDIPEATRSDYELFYNIGRASGAYLESTENSANAGLIMSPSGTYYGPNTCSWDNNTAIIACSPNGVLPEDAALYVNPHPVITHGTPAADENTSYIVRSMFAYGAQIGSLTSTNDSWIELKGYLELSSLNVSIQNTQLQIAIYTELTSFDGGYATHVSASTNTIAWSGNVSPDKVDLASIIYTETNNVRQLFKQQCYENVTRFELKKTGENKSNSSNNK